MRDRMDAFGFSESRAREYMMENHPFYVHDPSNDRTLYFNRCTIADGLSIVGHITKYSFFLKFEIAADGQNYKLTYGIVSNKAKKVLTVLESQSVRDEHSIRMHFDGLFRKYFKNSYNPYVSIFVRFVVYYTEWSFLSRLSYAKKRIPMFPKMGLPVVNDTPERIGRVFIVNKGGPSRTYAKWPRKRGDLRFFVDMSIGLDSSNRIVRFRELYGSLYFEIHTPYGEFVKMTDKIEVAFPGFQIKDVWIVIDKCCECLSDEKRYEEGVSRSKRDIQEKIRALKEILGPVNSVTPRKKRNIQPRSSPRKTIKTYEERRETSKEEKDLDLGETHSLDGRDIDEWSEIDWATMSSEIDLLRAEDDIDGVSYDPDDAGALMRDL